MNSRGHVVVIAALTAVIFAVSLIFCIGLFRTDSQKKTAKIYQDGVCIYSLDLANVNEPYEITVEDGTGYNIIRIERGRICVKEADCPDGICVQSGWISDRALPIVCLPHRLVITLE